MNRRIGYWALAGFAVACTWVIIGFLVPRGVQFGRWTITAITAPASIIARSVHFPMKWYEFVFLNTALYLLVGVAVEPFRHLRRRSPSV